MQIVLLLIVICLQVQHIHFLAADIFLIQFHSVPFLYTCWKPGVKVAWSHIVIQAVYYNKFESITKCTYLQCQYGYPIGHIKYS